MQVLDERGVALVEAREEAFLHGPEIILVRVPPAEIHSDEPHAGLDEAAREEHALRPAGGVATGAHAAAELGGEAIAVAEGGGFRVEVEGLARGVAAEDVPRLTGEVVHGLNLAVGIHLAAHAVEALDEPAPVGEAVDGEALGEREVRQGEGAGIRRVHAGLEGQALRAEVGGAGAGNHLGNHHVGRQRGVLMLKLLGHDGPDARVRVDAFVRPVFLAGEDDLVAVGVVHAAVFLAVGDAADDGELVHDLGGQGQVLADVNAGDAGGDGVELAAKLAGRVGLRVPGLVLRRAAALVEDDDGVLALGGTGLGLRLGAEKIGKCQAGGAEHAGVDEAATRHVEAAELVTTRIDSSHSERPR